MKLNFSNFKYVVLNQGSVPKTLGEPMIQPSNTAYLNNSYLMMIDRQENGAPSLNNNQISGILYNQGVSNTSQIMMTPASQRLDHSKSNNLQSSAINNSRQKAATKQAVVKVGRNA